MASSQSRVWSTLRLAGFLLALALIAALPRAGDGPARAQEPNLQEQAASSVNFVGKPPPTGALAPPFGGVNITVNQDASGSPQNETSIAINPTNPLNLVGGANDYRGVAPNGQCGFYSSPDRGATWSDGLLPLVGGFTSSGDPGVAFNANGHVYYLCMNFNAGAGDATQYVLKSLDGGLTWGPSVLAAGAVAANFDDKGAIAVDDISATGNKGNIYVSFTRINTGQIRFNRSTTGGASFDGCPGACSDQVINDVNPGVVQGSNIGVGQDGDVYVIWADNNGGATSRIRLDKSTDGGATFNALGGDVTVRTMTAIGNPDLAIGGVRPLARVNSFPVVDTSPTSASAIYALWAENPAGADDSDIMFARSLDGGATWGAPVRVNDDINPSGDFHSQFFPWMAVDPLTGDITVVWYDDRNDPDRTDGTPLVDLYYANSDDNGLSFSVNKRISTASSDPTVQFGTPFFGDYNGIDTRGGLAHPLWTDSRTGDEDVMSVQVGGADLSITKTDNVDPVIAGLELIYTITVENEGPATAFNVEVLDTLPLEVEYLADTGNCTFSAGTGPGGEDQLTCDLGAIGPFKTKQFDIKVLVKPDAVVQTTNGTKVINNTATVSSDEEDPDETDNTATEPTFVEELADLRIVKWSKPEDEAAAGHQITYFILVDNLGPSAARDVVIRDTMSVEGTDADAVFVDPNGCSIAIRTDGGLADEFECNFAQSVGIFTLGTFGANWLMPLRLPDEEGRVIVTINLTADGPVDINNEAIVDADTPDPDTANNRSEDGVTVVAQSDLQLCKADSPGAQLCTTQASGSAGPDPVVAGNNLQYELEVVNNGPSTAPNVVVEDVLPAEVEIVSITPSQGTCAAGTPGDPNDPTRCTVGTLLSGESATIVVVVKVKPDAVTNPVTDQKIIQNDATVYSDNADPSNGDNSVSADTTVNASADLALAKFGVGTPRAGADFTYEYDLSNLGPSTSRDLSLRDFLPDEVEFKNAYVDMEGQPGGVPLPCTVTDGTNVLICPLGDIPPTDGVPILVFVNVHIKSDVPDSTVITNTADVNLTDTPDPDPGNNSDSAAVTVLTTADVGIEKSSQPEKVNAGEQKKYTITVTNYGPSDALDVVVTDTLPAQVSYEIDTDNCVEGPPGVLTCTLGTLKPGEVRTFDIFVLVDPGTPAGTEILNEACVASNTTLGDQNPDNDCDTSRNLVLGSSDLKVTKFCKPDEPLLAGNTGTCTILVDNLGPGIAENVVVRDTHVSDGTFDVLAVNNDVGATCSPTSGNFAGSAVIVCDGFSLTKGQRATITVDLKADEPQDINDDADVTSDAADPYLPNNQAQGHLTVVSRSDLSISKSDNPDPVVAGTVLTYTLSIANAGPSDAINVVVEDVLPAGVSLISSAPSQGACDGGTPVGSQTKLTCNLGTVASGGNASISIAVFVDSDLPEGTILTNNASVSSDNVDQNNGNNTTNEPTTVTTSADLSIFKIGPVQPDGTDGDKIRGGETEEYRIRVTNGGPSTARNVIVTDVFEDTAPLGSGLRIVSEPSFCTIQPDGLSAECSLGDIPTGTFVDIVYKVEASLSKPDDVFIDNTATATSPTFDPNAANNSVVETTEWTDALGIGPTPLHDFPCVFRDNVRLTSLGVDLPNGRIRFIGPDGFDTGVIPATIISVGSFVYVSASDPTAMVAGAGICPAGAGQFFGIRLLPFPPLGLQLIDLGPP